MTRRISMKRPAILVLALLAVAASGCGGQPEGSGTTDPGYAVSGYAHAGPTCPVEQDPPDPACDDRPVAGAVLIVRTTAGEVVTEITTASDGTFTVTLPPGSYTLEPQPVEDLMGTASEQQLLVVDTPLTGNDLAYDTGIRRARHPDTLVSSRTRPRPIGHLTRGTDRRPEHRPGHRTAGPQPPCRTWRPGPFPSGIGSRRLSRWLPARPGR